jgi:DNA-binding FadR family transcriptional regulator
VPDRVGGKLCSRVTAELGGRIVAGDYVPDQVLPTEADLCSIFGVSRTTVREAVNRLHGKGMVDGRPRKGTRVLPTARWNQFDAELLSWRMQRGVTAEIVDQLYEVRDCFEPRACALAAVHGGPAEKARIRAHFQVLVDANLGTEQRVAADFAFHLAIFAATGNLFLISLGSAIRTALQLSLTLSQRRSPMSRAEEALHNHLCRAILRGDAEASARHMRRLLNASRRAVRRALAVRTRDHATLDCDYSVMM